MPFIRQQLTADGVSPTGELARVILATAILEMITNDHVDTISVGTSGGTGYAIGDTFSINDGSNVPVALYPSNGNDIVRATVRVTSVAAGVVDGVQLLSAGSYTTLATGADFATTTLTGAGSGCQIDIDTIQTALWTEDSRTGLDNSDPQVGGDWLASSVKAANNPTIGMETNTVSTNQALRMVVGTSYDVGLPWRNQPGNPPNSDAYVALPNQDPFLYLSTTERRVNFMITDGTSKQYGGMGLFLPFVDVDSNWPFPGIIHGQATTVRAFSEVYNTSNRGVLHPLAFTTQGCYQYRNNLSTEWFGLTSDNNSGTAPNARGMIWPNQGERGEFSLNRAPVPTNAVGTTDADDMTPGAGPNGQAATSYAKIYGSFNEQDWFASDADANMLQGPAPYGLGTQLHFTVQAHIISVITSDCQPLGVIDGWEAVHMRALQEFDEIESPSGKRYLTFSDTNDTTLYRGCAMEII